MAEQQTDGPGHYGGPQGGQGQAYHTQFPPLDGGYGGQQRGSFGGQQQHGSRQWNEGQQQQYGGQQQRQRTAGADAAGAAGA